MAKVLMVLTSHDRLGDTGQPTGFWLEEFAAPYYVLKDAGVDITIASPKGGAPPVDPKSDDPKAETPAMTRFRKDPGTQRGLANTVKLSTVSAGDYDAVFYSGRPRAVVGSAEDRDSIDLIERLYAAGKPRGRGLPWPGGAAPRQGADQDAAGRREGGDRLRQQRGSRGRAHERGSVPGGGRARRPTAASTPRRRTGRTMPWWTGT